jgi:hypothetical protein
MKDDEASVHLKNDLIRAELRLSQTVTVVDFENSRRSRSLLSYERIHARQLALRLLVEPCNVVMMQIAEVR